MKTNKANKTIFSGYTLVSGDDIRGSSLERRRQRTRVNARLELLSLVSKTTA